MNTRSLKRGNLQRYSFKDLEYGLKLMNNNIDDIKTTKRVLKKLEEQKKASGHFSLDKALENEIEHFQEVISLIQDEIADRLLTGNDDNVVIRELLGAKGV